MMKKPKMGTYTAKTCLAELEQIRTRYRKVTKGQNEELRSSLQRAQRIIARLHKDSAMLKDFTRLILKRKRENEGARETPFKLSLEVVVAAVGVGRNARKLASKRARVLDHLREIGTPVSETAVAIKKKGGIEKIYQKLLGNEKKPAGENESRIERQSKSER